MRRDCENSQLVLEVSTLRGKWDYTYSLSMRSVVKHTSSAYLRNIKETTFPVTFL